MAVIVFDVNTTSVTNTGEIESVSVHLTAEAIGSVGSVGIVAPGGTRQKCRGGAIGAIEFVKSRDSSDRV